MKYIGPHGSSASIGKIEFYAERRRSSARPSASPARATAAMWIAPSTAISIPGMKPACKMALISASIWAPRQISPPRRASRRRPATMPIAQTLTLTLPKGKRSCAIPLDGSTPGATGGTRYSAPIPLAKGFIPVTVVSYEKNKFPGRH